VRKIQVLPKTLCIRLQTIVYAAPVFCCVLVPETEIDTHRDALARRTIEHLRLNPGLEHLRPAPTLAPPVPAITKVSGAGPSCIVVA
jgi:hypothetical protein